MTAEPSIPTSAAQPPYSPILGRRTAALLLALILVGSALLRLGGINFGLPNLYHWDEKMYFHGAFYTWATGGSTESLVYGNVSYLILPVIWLVAAVRGLLPGGIPAAANLYLSDPTPFYLAGRILWVGLQVLAIWICYSIGARYLSRTAGLLASASLGASFLSVSEGHYVKGDSTAMLGAVLSAWAALRLLQKPRRWSYVLLGAAVGLSVAFKFYTYTLILLPILAHVLAWRAVPAIFRKWWLLALAGLAAAGALLLALPAPLIAPASTLETLKIEAAASLASVSTEGQPLWLYYWTGHLRNGLGWPLLLAGLAGFALWAWRRDSERLVLLAVPLLLWLGIVSRSNGFARYALPIVPFVCLAAGDFLVALGSYLNARLHLFRFRPRFAGGLLPLIASLLLLPSFMNDLRFDAYTASVDTRTLAAQWIEKHIPTGASIVEEGGQGFEAISTLGPPLRPSASSAGVSWSPTSLKPPSEFWTVPLLTWLQAYTPTYKLTFAATLTRRTEITSTASWGNPDAFVMLSWRSNPELGTPASPFWDDLHRNYRLAQRFDCSPCFPNDPYAWAVDYSTLQAVDLSSRRRTIAGPNVWVYTRK